MGFLPDVDAELQAIKDHALQQHATASRTGSVFDEVSGLFHPQTDHSALVQRLSDYQKQYFWLKPVVQYALAKSGVDPGSPTAKTAALAGGQVAQDNLDFNPSGQPVKAGFLRSLGVAAPLTQLQADFDQLHQAQPVNRNVVQPGSFAQALFGTQSARKGLGMQKTAWDALPQNVRDELTQVSFTQVDTSEATPIYNYKQAPVEAVYQVDGAEALSPDAKAVLDRVIDNNGMSQQGPWTPVKPSGFQQPAKNLLLAGGAFIPGSDNGVSTAGGFGGSNPVVSVAGLVPSKEASQGLNTFIRTSSMAMNAPIQELQGQAGNLFSAVHGGDPNIFQSQSDLGVTVDNLIHGESVDSGQGFFVDPASPVAQERRARQLQRGNIGGHTITPGRWAADLFFEPDTKPFNALSGAVDLAVALKGDPTNIALSKFSELRAADKMFTEAGGLFGLERTVSPGAVEKWLDGKDGQAVVNWLANHAKTYDVMEGLRRKGSPELWSKLADAQSPDEVRAILKPELATSIMEKPDLGRASVIGQEGRLTAVRSRQSVRLFNTLPGQFVDVEDAHNAVTQTELWLRNAHAPTSMVYDFVDRMARAPDRFARYKVLDDMMGSTKGILVQKYGVDPENAWHLTTMQSTATAKMRQDFIDDAGNTVNPWTNKAKIGDTVVDTPTPHLLSEHINRLVSLPDARAVRRIASKLSPVVSTEEGRQRFPLAAAQMLQDEIWKPMALLRGAWTLRVVGEEQVRMAASGLDSLFRHPISAIAWIAGHKGSEDLLGNSWQDVTEHQQALTRGGGGFLDIPGQKLTGDWTVAFKRDEEMKKYMRGWATELAQLHGDPVASNVARFDNLQDAKDWFFDGPGQKFRQQLIGAGHDELSDPRYASDYIDSVARRVSIKTGDHPDLLEAVRTGKVDDVHLADLASVGINRDAVKRLSAYIDSGPAAVKVERLLKEKGPALKDRYDRGVQTMFGFLMSKPTNYLSRSPTFRQAYWDRVSTLMPFMTIDAQQAAIKSAEDAGITGGLLKKITGARGTTGEVALDHADMLAKGHALDYTRGLLYDLSERSQFFDVLRLVAPFGEAWKEVLTRWAKIFTERPQNLRRLQQGIEGARGSDFGGMVGAPAGDGFFYRNDRGEEVFVYPGSQWLTSKLTGVPIPLTGRVQGLNLIGNFFPALGPVAQIPVSYFLPDKPEYDFIRNTVFPYGDPGDPISSPIQYWMPAWAKRILTPEHNNDPDSVRTYANSVMDVARYLASTGDYDLSTEDGQSKLMADAKDKAGKFNIIRSIGQFFAPSAPSPEWLVKDKNGDLLKTATLAQEYRDMQNADYQNASQNFLDKYGTDAFLVMQSKTQSVSYGYPVNSEGLAWMRSNPDVETKYPNVFGYFAPQGGDFNYSAYLRAISGGAKNPLTLNQFVKLGEAKLASITYDQAKQKMPANPTDKQRAWLRDIQDSLIKEYPGYGESLEGRLGLTERASPQGKVDEITAAMKDDRLAGTDAGQATVVYLGARDKAKALSVKAGLSDSGFQKANRMRSTRDWLRDIGTTLVTEHPDFAPLWEQVFSREINDDTDVQKAAG